MTFLTTILASAVTTTVIGGALIVAARTIFKGSIDLFFQRRLEQYKQRLEVLTESFKFDFERRMADFGHFIKQRHDIYSRLYELLQVANGLIRGLWGFRSELTFDEYSQDDMRKYLVQQKVVQGKIDEVLSKWDSDREESVKDVREYLRLIEHQRADSARQDAKNYLIVNALYITDALEQKVSALLGKMVELWVLYNMWATHGTDLKNEYEKTKQLGAEIDTLLKNVKDHMRKELSVGVSGYDTMYHPTSSA